MALLHSTLVSADLRPSALLFLNPWLQSLSSRRHAAVGQQPSPLPLPPPPRSCHGRVGAASPWRPRRGTAPAAPAAAPRASSRRPCARARSSSAGGQQQKGTSHGRERDDAARREGNEGHGSGAATAWRGAGGEVGVTGLGGGAVSCAHVTKGSGRSRGGTGKCILLISWGGSSSGSGVPAVVVALLGSGTRRGSGGE